MESTKPTKISEIKRQWYLIDAKDQILGRTATQIALLLMGKSKPYFVKNLDCGDYVVVINAKDIKVTGKKESDKMYYRHSGYPGGFKSESYNKLKARRPGETIKRAVLGMVPQTKLRDRMLKRLYVFESHEHPYQNKFKSEDTKAKS